MFRWWVDEAEIIATLRVAYPRRVSALNQRMRTGEFRSGTRTAVRAVRGLGSAAVVDFTRSTQGEWREIRFAGTMPSLSSAP